MERMNERSSEWNVPEILEIFLNIHVRLKTEYYVIGNIKTERTKNDIGEKNMEWNRMENIIVALYRTKWFARTESHAVFKIVSYSIFDSWFSYIQHRAHTEFSFAYLNEKYNENVQQTKFHCLDRVDEFFVVQF